MKVQNFKTTTPGRKILLVFTSLVITLSAPAQNNFWNSKDAYLGEKPPGNSPRLFPDKLLVDSGILIGRIAITNDGREFYYTSAYSWNSREGSAVKRRRFVNNTWQAPEILAPMLSTPTLSPDQHTLYFGGSKGSVWKSVRNGDSWTEPVRYIEMPMSLYNFMPTRSGNIYAGSNGDRGPKNDFSKYDFSMVQFSGKDTLVVSLGKPLNTDAFDGDLYISPDESYMIISAKETPTYESELWISFRRKDNSWTAPVSLGDDINKGPAHRFGQYVTPDGKYLFYNQGTSEKDTHLYWLRWDIRLKELRSQSN